jgi:ribose 5-phosphate isomerase A
VNLEHLKQRAAQRAVEFVRPGMVLGLGHGSTTAFAVRHISALLKSGELADLLAVPASTQVEREARRLNITLTTLDEHTDLDLTIDGADEVDPHLELIKGGGGALLREKMLAQASRRVIIVVDESKLSPVLGTHFPVPIEVTSFGWPAQRSFLETIGATVSLRCRSDGSVFRTDGGNLILNCDFGPIGDPARLAARLADRAGILEHGLFLGLASDVIVATHRGVRHITRESA